MTDFSVARLEKHTEKIDRLIEKENSKARLAFEYADAIKRDAEMQATCKLLQCNRKLGDIEDAFSIIKERSKYND